MKKLEEKYEYNGWPSIDRPDIKPPEGWSLHLATAGNRVRNHSLAPDGTKVAFIWDREDLSDVYIQALHGGWPQRVSVDRGRVAYWSDSEPQWSPDGAWLTFAMNDHVYVTSSDGRLPHKISDFAESVSSPVWMPNSRDLLVSVERGESLRLLLTNCDGAWPRPLVDRADGDVWDAQPSPDGQLVAYTFRPFADLNRLDIHVVEVESGHIRELVGSAKVRNRQARWSPDGVWLAFLSQQSGWTEVWLVRPDGSGLRQLTNLGVEVEQLAWSPEGTRIALTVNRSGAVDLAVVEMETGRVRDLVSGEGYFSGPQWGPDGSWLTVEYESAVQPPDIYRVEVDGGRMQALTWSALPGMVVNGLVNPERVSYRSYDGLEIPAFLYRPAKPNGAAILFPHGGPSAQYFFEWDYLAQYFVAKGYTWLAPNYRGSTGYGVAFEHANHNDWGNGDMQDCLHGANYLRSLPGIDAQRIAIYGGSYGGYMTACCLSRDPEYRFACGIDKYGDANLISSWAQCNRDLRLYSQIFLGHPSTNRETYMAGSPIYQVKQVQKPVLILHGLLDDVVPPEASEEWVAALRRENKTFEYKTYADEPHGFLKRSTQLDAYRRMERFLDWYLLP